eukprot:3023120-Rhodomonas_salina.1
MAELEAVVVEVDEAEQRWPNVEESGPRCRGSCSGSGCAKPVAFAAGDFSKRASKRARTHARVKRGELAVRREREV